jgi:hypothetical protein
MERQSSSNEVIVTTYLNILWNSTFHWLEGKMDVVGESLSTRQFHWIDTAWIDILRCTKNAL